MDRIHLLVKGEAEPQRNSYNEEFPLFNKKDEKNMQVSKAIYL